MSAVRAHAAKGSRNRRSAPKDCRYWNCAETSLYIRARNAHRCCFIAMLLSSQVVGDKCSFRRGFDLARRLHLSEGRGGRLGSAHTRVTSREPVVSFKSALHPQTSPRLACQRLLRVGEEITSHVCIPSAPHLRPIGEPRNPRSSAATPPVSELTDRPDLRHIWAQTREVISSPTLIAPRARSAKRGIGHGAERNGGTEPEGDNNVPPFSHRIDSRSDNDYSLIWQQCNRIRNRHRS